MSDRLWLREFRESDLGVLAGMVGDADQMTFYPRPKTRGEASAWIRRNRALYREQGFGFWLIELLPLARFAGYCGIRQPTRRRPRPTLPTRLGHIHPDRVRTLVRIPFKPWSPVPKGSRRRAIDPTLGTLTAIYADNVPLVNAAAPSVACAAQAADSSRRLFAA